MDKTFYLNILDCFILTIRIKLNHSKQFNVKKKLTEILVLATYCFVTLLKLTCLSDKNLIKIIKKCFEFTY